ncbi:MucBP domain-containing protein [Candidatus Enterococcus ferrettii]|uniref:MucBP domain-containing protein n=1 Tax=Candidatus Enterococcus ferrettii TaxID=2815324 RepID=UPI001A9C1513|nr:MucBP domain-containing protein [Enterococcus sp. 665A]MBO1339781.1 MucBP domain-containing protein [Enterococcus sp. 665A]
MKKRINVLAGLGLLLLSLGLAGQKAFADEVAVNTVADLQDAVNNAPSDRTVTLDSTFPTDIDATIALKESPYQVVVNGNGLTLQSTTGKQLFSYGGGTGTANSALTIRNLNLEGLGNSVRALTISGYKGEFVLENSKVNNFQSYDDGGAFYTAGNTSLVNCTFSNNKNTGSGYSGGAIASKGYSANFSASNCQFLNNETTFAGTGNVGGEGGAIYFFQPSSTATFNFTNNYFEGNKSVETITSGKAKLADGGAIAFFNTVTGTQILFDSNSFVRNIAGDDGGAILIQTNDNIDSGVLFKNNTFYQNKALGQDFSGNSGGAIQIYANGAITQGRKSAIDYVNNSFVENEAVYDGGAIGSSGYGLNYSAGRYANNLFVGNKSRTASRNNIADSTAIAGTGDLETNIGYDNGKTSTTTMTDVFGTAPVGLVDNYNKITAGTNSDAIILPTVPIAPEKAADDQVDNLRDILVDQRDLPRTAKADIGSVEIDWIKYDSNGGIFDLGTELSKYEGMIYYEGTQPTAYYQVGYKELNQTIPKGVELKAAKEGYQFAGWSKDETAKEPDPTYAEGNTLAIPKGNETLYAVWKKSEPVIVHYMTYDENKQLVSISPDVTLTGALGEAYHAQIKQIDEYTFAGVKEGDSITGVFSDQPQEITLIYTKTVKEKGTVLAQYQDEEGNPLSGDEVTMGEVDTDYTTQQKDIPGYTFKEVQGEPSGKYVAGITKVVYIYTKNPVEQGKVIVHYQKEDGTSLAADQTLTGDIDDYYAAEVKAFDGYVLKGITGSISGKFTAADQEVTLIYTEQGIGKETGVLIVEYQNEEGQPLRNSEVSIAEIGESYKTSRKEISGYTFKEVQGAESGEYAEGITKVTYIYQKNVTKGKLIVHYQDEAGKTIAEDFSDEQPVDTAIPLELFTKTIDSYTLKEIKGLTSGFYTEKTQEVTVVYRKQEGKVLVNYLSEEGKQLANPALMSGAVNSDYQTEEKKFEGYVLKEVLGNKVGKYTLEPQIVTYIYSNKGTIAIHYVDEAGNELAAAEQQTGVIGEKYETTAKAIAGWKLKDAPENAKGTYQEQEQTITYVYVKDSLPTTGDGSATGGGTGTVTTPATVRTLPDTGTAAAQGKTLPKTGDERSNTALLSTIGILTVGAAVFLLRKRSLKNL